MSRIADNKENIVHVTYSIEPNLIEIGMYIFDLITHDCVQLIEHLIRTDIDVVQSITMYQNENGENAYDFALSNKKDQIVRLLDEKIYKKQRLISNNDSKNKIFRYELKNIR